MGQVPVRTTAALAMLPSLPEYVKAATYVDRDERKALPGRAFAAGDRRYPVHTKAAAFVSAVEYWAEGVRIPAVEEGLRKAAGLFGIERDIHHLPYRVGPSQRKQASADGDFAFVGGDGGEPVRLFPMLTENEILKSAAAVESERQYLTYPMRREAARNLLKRAGELNLTLPAFIHKAAGAGPATYGAALGGLMNRVAVAPPHRRDLYRKLAASLQDEIGRAGAGSDAVMADPEGVAELIDTADRVSGLHVKYARGLETPEEICWHGEAPAALTMRLSKKRLPVGEVKRAGLTLDDLAPLGEQFTEAVRTPFLPFDKSAGIDYVKLTVAAENLSDHDSLTLANIVRDKMRGAMV